MVDVWVKSVYMLGKEWLQMWDDIKRLCKGGDVHFTSAPFASHEAPETVFYGKGDANGMKECSGSPVLEMRGWRHRIASKVMSMRSCCAFPRLLCLRSVDLRKSFCGNGDANDMKECSGSAVLEMKRLQMWDGIETLC